MPTKKHCPKCGTGNIKIVKFIGIDCVVCGNCGFDESSQYEVFGEKKSQKAKGSYTPYKSGGHDRGKK